ncbi:hypothetical protein [Nannocystis radixulma]|uniref:Haloacid dehalogenase-like hydrolase n=1 Tax=Nannocystis radixulma TaxID=2995305 RepID=A0ABT5BNW2_9BACT|nr:hypothetical protein [Nannocystis radixulma]MDC0675792.1 hypothetical protein [Nannocystis radixulma]
MTALQAVIFDRDGVLTAIDRTCLMRQVLARAPLSERALAERWSAWLGGRPLVGADDEDAARLGFLRQLAADLQLDDEARAELLALDYASCVRAYPEARAALLATRRRSRRVRRHTTAESSQSHPHRGRRDPLAGSARGLACSLWTVSTARTALRARRLRRRPVARGRPARPD